MAASVPSSALALSTRPPSSVYLRGQYRHGGCQHSRSKADKSEPFGQSRYYFPSLCILSPAVSLQARTTHGEIERFNYVPFPIWPHVRSTFPSLIHKPVFPSPRPRSHGCYRVQQLTRASAFPPPCVSRTTAWFDRTCLVGRNLFPPLFLYPFPFPKERLRSAVTERL